MKRLVIIETGNHVEVVGAYIAIFLKFSNVQIVVHCRPKLKTELSISENKDKVNYVDLADNDFTKYGMDDAIILTSPINFKKFKFSKFSQVYLVVHNIKTTFFPAVGFFWQKFNIPTFIKYALIPFYRNKPYYKKIAGFIFLAENIEEKNAKIITKWYPLQKRIVLPTFRFDIKAKQNANGELTITIPGAFDQRRRANLEVLLRLKELEKEKIKIIFLGSSPLKFRSKAKLLSNKNLIISTFDKAVNRNDYYNLLSKSDYILLTNRNFKFFAGVKEENGVSTTSATLIDTFSLGIPTIIPEGLPIPTEISAFYMTYSSYSEMITLIKRLSKTWDGNKTVNFRNNSAKYFNNIIEKGVKEILQTKAK